MFKLCVGIACLLLARTADAFFDAPWITPANPRSSDILSVNIHGGVCDSIYGREGYPQLTRDGNALRMIWYGEHWPEGSGDLLCSNPIGTLSRPFGTLPAGNYTLKVDLAYSDFIGPGLFTIGTASFTVQGLPVFAIPTPVLDGCAIAILLVIIIVLANWKLRREYIERKGHRT